VGTTFHLTDATKHSFGVGVIEGSKMPLNEIEFDHTWRKNVPSLSFAPPFLYLTFRFQSVSVEGSYSYKRTEEKKKMKEITKVGGAFRTSKWMESFIPPVSLSLSRSFIFFLPFAPKASFLLQT